MASDTQGICYSGYRHGQSPDSGIFPTREQIIEDLRLLEGTWQHLRMYDSGTHAAMVLDIIEREGLDFEIMLGAYISAEVNNHGCPWGGVYSEARLASNVLDNTEEIARLINLAQRYPTIVTSVSAGNEATVDWTDHLVPVDRVIEYVRTLKSAIDQPVTFCENHVPWMGKLAPLVDELDFISLHTYPVWEYRSIEEAILVTDRDYHRIVEKYPNTPVRITEAGWTTRSNGRGIDPHNASTELQTMYLRQLSEWCEEHGVLAYVFEAFDEPWKGSQDPDEPEKHWGLFTVDRRPKPVMREVYGAGAR